MHWRRAASGFSRPKQAKVVFSGIQPTGVPHLGNYLGALRQWVKLQNEEADSTKLMFSLVDLHAITLQQDADSLRAWKDQSLAMLLAIGLDPERCILFHQSEVPAHTELMWILSCQASTGYLGRMTQWKEKTADERANNPRLKLGLFSYPVLQAADVLVHAATHVPVGHDQAQHLEFTRELAIGFNQSHGKQILIPPETVISPARRVMSLTQPTAKMSKSDVNPKSRIVLTDSNATIRAKLKSALTDTEAGITYDPTQRPGVSNLLDILYHVRDEDRGDQIELAKTFEGQSLKMLKESVAEAVITLIEPIRERYLQLIEDKVYLREIAQSGAQRAAENAADTLASVKQAIGLS